MDFVLQARDRMAEEKVSGPEDSVVAEMIKELLQEKVYEITRCSRWLHGVGRCCKLLANYETGKSDEARRRTKKGHQKRLGDCAHIGDVEVVHDLHQFTSGKEAIT